MGTFYVRCKVENHVDRAKSVIVPKLLVDMSSNYTWIPATQLEKIGTQREKKALLFMKPNGQRLIRSIGFAIIRLDDCLTIDEVVFAEKGDLLRLGTRALKGFNLAFDQHRKKLISPGPLTV